MPRFDKPKKRSAKVLIYKDLKDEFAHIDELQKRCEEEAPERGTQYNTGADYEEDPVLFGDMPLSKRTLLGLADGGFEHMTRIQAASLPHALAGRDILGAAKTGSVSFNNRFLPIQLNIWILMWQGKTLSFLIPCIEHLWRQKWSSMDGLGCLIISPTRELAIQIFDVLRAVGKHHTFSAGILIGGKKEFREEQQRITSMCILVATPGRLVQHLEQTHGFDVSTLQMLVLDEADRILDMGFRDQLTSVLQYLPEGERQTMLFSATQTKSIKDLARLSLDQPEYIAVHEKTENSTPTTLTQHYMVIHLKDKLDALYSFIKAHLKAKTIIFFATCSQVRFAYECFRTLQPGVPLMALHGKHKQARRTFTFMNFVAKPAAVLFATDIAARGLDFPEVDWVVQVDAPEDSAMYIHRVGRTARYRRDGKALLLLLPNEEEPFLELLGQAKVPPMKRLSMNPNMKVSIAQKAAAINASKPEIKKLASKAYLSYARSVHMMPNKTCFNIQELPLSEYATSLGLAIQPSLKFLESEDTGGEKGGGETAREENRSRKNVNKKLEQLKQKIKDEKLRKKRAREGGTDKIVESEVVDDDLLVKKSRLVEDDDEVEEEDAEEVMYVSKKKKKNAKQRIDINVGNEEVRLNKKVRFGEEGEQAQILGTSKLEKDTNPDCSNVIGQNEKFLELVRERMAATSELDKEESKAKLREKKNKKKWANEETNGPMATLGVNSDGSDEEAGSDASTGSGESNSDDDDTCSSEDEDVKQSKYDLTVTEAEAAVMRVLASSKN